MQVTKAKLRERRIYNPHNLAELADDPKICVYYSPQTTGVTARYGEWVVGGIGFRTNWRDEGRKTFTVHHRDYKEPKLQEAIAWAEEKYGIDAWERSPFGSYHPVGTLKRAMQLEAS